MPVNISRLRLWFALALAAVIVAVLGFYVYGRVQGLRRMAELPQKLGVEIQQTTQGFTLSKSERGHTLYTIKAAKVTQLKQSGLAQLEDVNVLVYGRNATRFDRIYGKAFEYDPASGEVRAKGVVNIDLQSNPNGPAEADQSEPQVLKDPVRMVTSGLTFNAKTGNATTRERVEIRMAQATGYADGADYDSRENELTVAGNVKVTIAGEHPITVVGQSGSFTREPRQAVLHQARIVREATTTDANRLTLYFRPDDSVERVVGAGDVKSVIQGESVITMRAPQATFYLEGSNNRLQRGQMTGGTTFESVGASQVSGSADNSLLLFAEHDTVQKIEARGRVYLKQLAADGGRRARGPMTGQSGVQQAELFAEAMDFWVKAGKSLDWAETIGAGRVLMLHAPPAVIPPAKQLRTGEWVSWKPATTEVKADRLKAHFDAGGRIDSLHGDRARIWYESFDQPVRESRSRDLDVSMTADGQVSSFVQKGQFYSAEYPCMQSTNCTASPQRQAWAETATYTPGNNMMLLTGSPRVVDGGMTTTARRISMNRESGEAQADEDVKTTYSDLKPQPGGALLASGEPVHASGRRMTAERATGLAHYEGEARLWQGGNVIEGDKIHFDRNRRTIRAEASPADNWRKLVRAVLSRQEKDGTKTPVHITSQRLDYSDEQRLARFDGAVVARSSDGTTKSDHADVFLRPRDERPALHSAVVGLETGQVERIVATGSVYVQQPARQGWGDKLVYTAVREEFVLTGKAPRVMDAQRGNVYGDSLTFYNRDDRVLVEGSAGRRALTETRVSK